MGTQSFRSLLAATILLGSVPAMAHDPSEHGEAAVKPDCTAMDDRGHDGMDMKDPVAQAMMKQCMNAMHKESTSTKRESTEGPASDEPMTEQGGSHDHHEG